MRYKLLILIALICSSFIGGYAQESTDTIYNPPVIFSSTPKKYELAGIKVSGNGNYEEFVIIGYSGLKIGDVIEVPGQDITLDGNSFLCYPFRQYTVYL